MAIGFSLPGIPGQIRGTAEEAGAVPDLGQAMMQGFRSNLENIQGAPRLLAQKLVSNQLANTINKAKADYAQRMAQTGYEQALADLQNRNLINQYYPRMRESELKSAGLSQAHQQMVNQFYPDLIKSQLSGQGLTQEHQRMVNEIMKRQIDRQKRYDELLEQYRQQGATPEVAHQLAVESVNETHPMPTQEPKQISEQPQKPVDLMELLSGKQMPDYLSEMAPAEQTLPEVLGQNVPYSAMEQPEIGLRYTPFGINKQQIAGRESPLHKLIRQNYEQRDAALNAAFGSPMKFGLEQQLQNYLLNKTTAPSRTSIDAEAQGYQNITPLQAPELQRQEALAQAFQLPPIPQEAPDYLQRPEEPAIAATEVEEEAAPTEVSAPQKPQTYVEKLQQAGYNTANANPIYAAEDQFYLQRPDYRDLLKQRFPNIGVKQYNDFPRNRVITTETLPSGATRTQINQLPGTLPGQGATGGKVTSAALSTPLGRAIARRNYVETYGEKSEEVKAFDKNAKEMDKNEELARQLKQQQLEQGKEKIELQKEANQFRRQALEVQKRKGLGKVGMAFADLMDAKGGFIPGTDKKFLTPEDQQNAIKTIQASINKIATDSKQREMLVASKQIDNTIKNLDVDALVQYSGIYGEAFKKGEKIKSGLGLTSPEYKRYSEAAELAKFLAKQVRKFYGESIQKYSVEAINALTNPSQWAASPDVAKQNYQTFVKNLLQETDIAKEFFIYADSFDKGKKLTTARTQAVDDELKKIEEEMKKRGMKVGG